MPLIDDDRFLVAPPTGVEPRSAPVSEPLLAVDRISKRWPQRSAPTLDDLELEMRAGDVVSITGRNGAGKTTLLRVIGGLVAPDRGTVYLGGLRLGSRRRAYQRQVGLLTPGDRGLYARLTVRRHLDLWARLSLLETAVRTAAIASCTERFELAEIAEQRVDRLSMGQRQRVRLALAFLHTPRLVLLDEPAASLDLEGLDVLRRAIDTTAAGGGMCIVVVPEGTETGVAVGRALALRDGRLQGA